MGELENIKFVGGIVVGDNDLISCCVICDASWIWSDVIIADGGDKLSEVGRDDIDWFVVEVCVLNIAWGIESYTLGITTLITGNIFMVG